MSTTSTNSTVQNLEKDEAQNGFQFKSCPCECDKQADRSVDEFFKQKGILLGPGTQELTGVFSKLCRLVQVIDHNLSNSSFEEYNGPAPQVTLQGREFGSGDAVCNIGYEFTFEAGHVPSSDALNEIGKKLSDAIKRDLGKLSDGSEYLPTAIGWAVTGSDISFSQEYGGEFDIIEEFSHAVGAERGLVLSIPIVLPFK